MLVSELILNVIEGAVQTLSLLELLIMHVQLSDIIALLLEPLQ
jgi:hypothetical protein